MWPTLPPPMPTLSPGFATVDAGAMLALLLVGTVVAAVVFVVLALRLTRERPEPRVVHCPTGGTRAVVVVFRRSDGTPDAVGHCSHWSTSRGAGCDHACLGRAA